jgi:cytochrome c oxidase cbb3-type subunit 2
LRARRREVLATLVVLAVAWFVNRSMVEQRMVPRALTAVEHGRQVYIGEGCISCHSQYVRPGTADVERWGPTESVESLRGEHPPLIGNRRQGPDLAEVGSRRSALWLLAHFYDPAEVSHGSFMPAYTRLFADERGGDLVAYLQSLHGADEDVKRQWASHATWQPSAGAQANPEGGAKVYRAYCRTCHDEDGPTRVKWADRFRRLPPRFGLDALRDVPAGSAEERRARIAQIAKFGIQGTDMPGHEYLQDWDIASVSAWLAQRTAPVNEVQPPTLGEKP